MLNRTILEIAFITMLIFGLTLEIIGKFEAPQYTITGKVEPIECTPLITNPGTIWYPPFRSKMNIFPTPTSPGADGG